jgi:hypothetical protein
VKLALKLGHFQAVQVLKAAHKNQIAQQNAAKAAAE